MSNNLGATTVAPNPENTKGFNGLSEVTSGTPLFTFEKSDDQPNIDPYVGKTSRELYEIANSLKESGKIVEAADLYDRATHHHQAMRLWEQIGDLEKAKESAEKAGDQFEAGRIEQKIAQLPENPYLARQKAITEKEAQRGSIEHSFNLFEDISELGEKIGFHGFDNKVVADIGTRDGRFINLFYRLGASEVYGIDPDQESLQKAVDDGKLDEEHAVGTTLENIPDEIAEKIEAAAIFNFIIGLDQQQSFFKKLADILPYDGHALVTVAERETLNNMLMSIRGMFTAQYVTRVSGQNDFPHKYLVLLTKS
ncbi:class I SAM-dependent methyltransferase [Candidatus Saccharibacteria bacterium]|nr:class I SAM-dependent methyltransferase [Candidatus Saccharibacteria bacterium]